MEDSLITIIAIFLAAIMMFIFPLMSISDRNDDISQLAVQTQTVEFVDKVRSTGKLTLNDYDKFVETLSSTGNTYDIELELKVLDENPGKKGAQISTDKVGENVYYSEYTSQILDPLRSQKNNSTDNPARLLKEGDIISVSVKNTNITIAQMLKNFFYRISGNTSYQIEVQHAGVVTTNGK